MKVSMQKFTEMVGVSTTPIYKIIQNDMEELEREGIIEVRGKKLQKRYLIDFDKFKNYLKRKYPEKYAIIFEA